MGVWKIWDNSCGKKDFVTLQNNFSADLIYHYIIHYHSKLIMQVQ